MSTCFPTYCGPASTYSWVCTWSHPAPRQRIGSAQNHAAINAANAFSHADGIDHFRHVGLVPRGQAGLLGAGLASLWLDRHGARSGHVDDNTGARFLDVNVFVCTELQKANPNMIKIAAWMQRYFYVVVMQGIMQVLSLSL